MHQLKNVIVAGCGLHFKERYYEVLEKLKDKINISLIIDLVSEKEKIEKFFFDKSFQPSSYVFLPEQYRNNITPEIINQFIPKNVNLKEIDNIIICTEPKAHKAFAIWAMEYNLNVFTDKPITAFNSYENMDSLYDDFQELNSYLKKTKVNFVVSCERRGHLGYKYLKNYISEIIKETNVPITFLDIHFGGGLWNMPDEYFFRENHPHKYGYGILLHSGYHYVDLLINLISLNKSIFPLSVEESNLKTFITNPYTSMNVINNNVYSKLLKTNRFNQCFEKENINKMKFYGENDAMIMGQFKIGKEVITNYSLKLVERSVTKRSWHILPENTYLKNGRIRQENVIIHLGPLSSIHVKSHPYSKLTNTKDLDEDFTIDIMNNQDLLNKDALIQLKRSDFSNIFPELSLKEKMNKKSRQWQLIDFLNGGDGNSRLESHEDTIKFLDKIYKNIKECNYEIST
ncbi:MAG: Gfo/Idh/MocA family oxidoreductase [Sphingobacteriia bacterium]|nr:Gfo/Idh/MocA family oxidoreductase [Sphingobacteriia bacterium]